MRLTSCKPGGFVVQHMAAMADEERWRAHGRGHCDLPNPLVAGQQVVVRFAFDIGELEFGVGGGLAIAWRWPIDWADLQTDDATADGYLAATVPVGAAEIEVVYHRRGGFDPWHHHIELRVKEGCLRAGDRVEVVCGERGDAGWRAPTLVARDAGFLMLVRAGGDDDWIRLPDPPFFDINAGAAVRLVAIAPAEVVAGEMATVIVRGEDQWGNPARLAGEGPELCLAQDGDEQRIDAVEVLEYPAVYHFKVSIDRVGTCRCIARAGDLITESNPLRVLGEKPPRQLFWGDLHSGQTDTGCGAGKLEEHFDFARDAAGLQFASQQANDHYVTLEDWAYVRRVSHQYNEDGRFVSYLGCEWSPPTEDGGDRNIIYRGDEERLRRSGRFFTETEPDPEPDLPTAPELHAALRQEEVLLNLHVGGRPTNLTWHEPAIEPLAEIHSTHGTSEWFIEEALNRGYKVGITGGTDGVMTRPGACHPGWRLTRNVRSGLTGVYAEDLTRQGLWEAFKARRCYATSGARIRLWVEVSGYGMGEEGMVRGSPDISVQVEGTAALERVDLLRGTEVIHSWQIAVASAARLRVLWGGTEDKGTAHVQRVIWDGNLEVMDGKVQALEAIGLQSPCDVVEIDAAGRVVWQAATAGNDMGFSCQIVGEAQTQCVFSSGPSAFEFKLGAVVAAPLTVDAGGVGRRVSVGLAPREDGPQQAQLAFVDDEDIEGACAYWVRVVQVDQARAWSSPVYATRKKGE